MLRFCALAALLAALFAQPAPSASARQDRDEQRRDLGLSASAYLSHIRYLASDSLGGRGNGTEGLQRAGDYIASYLDSGGLQPAGDAGTFFQSFDGEMTIEPPPSATLIIRAGGTRGNLHSRRAVLPALDHRPHARRSGAGRRSHPGRLRRLRHVGARARLRRLRGRRRPRQGGRRLHPRTPGSRRAKRVRRHVADAGRRGRDQGARGDGEGRGDADRGRRSVAPRRLRVQPVVVERSAER